MTDFNSAELKPRLKALGLFGLIACWDHIADKPWLQEVLAIEERERKKRSLERRLRHSRVASFKPMTDFDWAWPKKIDREAIDELFTLAFIKAGHNTVLVGPNGVGKTMILNLPTRPSYAGTTCVLLPPATCSPIWRLRSPLRRSHGDCDATPCRTCSASTKSATSRTTTATPISCSRSLLAAMTPKNRSCSARTRRSQSSAEASRDRSRKLPPQGSKNSVPPAPSSAEARSSDRPFTGELHRPQARASPVNFTEFPRFQTLINTAW